MLELHALAAAREGVLALNRALKEHLRHYHIGLFPLTGGKTLLSQIWPLGGFWLWAQGLRANPAKSDLSPWRGFGFAAWGLKANPAESDLATWWVSALQLEVQEQTLLSQICLLGGFLALVLTVYGQTLMSQIWPLGGFWICGLRFRSKPC